MLKKYHWFWTLRRLAIRYPEHFQNVAIISRDVMHLSLVSMVGRNIEEGTIRTATWDLFL